MFKPVKLDPRVAGVKPYYPLPPKLAVGFRFRNEVVLEPLMLGSLLREGGGTKPIDGREVGFLKLNGIFGLP